jgi:Mg-chelatase subunit ChlD
MMCDSRALTPLTNEKGALNSAIGQLEAKGYTNIHEGVMWGWRTLSPGAPFTEGKSYSDQRNRKIMVVMTDGANTFPTANNMNDSWYSAYGYASENRLGNNLTNGYQLVAAMNQRTLEACANAKAARITVYTIAFDIDDNATRTMLRNCASSPSMAFTPSSTSDMIAAFVAIGKNINELRLSR